MPGTPWEQIVCGVMKIPSNSVCFNILQLLVLVVNVCKLISVYLLACINTGPRNVLHNRWCQGEYRLGIVDILTVVLAGHKWIHILDHGSVSELPQKEATTILI